MKVLITGSGSFIGRAITRKLVERGHTVAILRRASSGAPTTDDPRITSLPALEDPTSGRWQLPDLAGWRPAACLHLAWALCEKGQRDNPRHLELNYLNSLDLARRLAESGCSYFLGIGSQAEYGSPNVPLTAELMPRGPQSAYGLAKYLTGLATAKYCALAGMKHGWWRLTATYGPGERPLHFVPIAVQHIARGQALAMTHGEQRWDYLFIDDLTDALCLALEKQVTGIFPIGSGDAVTLRSIVETLRSLHPAPEALFGARPVAPGEPTFVQADIEPLSRALGWRPRVDIKEGLRRALEHELRTAE